MITLGFWALVGLLAGVFVALVVAGMISAWLEARRERAAGLPVSRPAWDRAAARRRGEHSNRGALAAARGYWKGLRS